ncbi:serine hydrolase [Streptomyces xanthophaeus]|uniref:D-alanyl-D-alanine carboxypeptidase n=1 Tax=Streptomyces xanthophaeus TaxID=67385 RepID=UPI0034307C79
MKAVTVAGGSPDTPDAEGTEVPTTEPGTQDTSTPTGAPGAPETRTPTPAGEPDASDPQAPTADTAAETAQEPAAEDTALPDDEPAAEDPAAPAEDDTPEAELPDEADEADEAPETDEATEEAEADPDDEAGLPDGPVEKAGTDKAAEDAEPEPGTDEPDVPVEKPETDEAAEDAEPEPETDEPDVPVEKPETDEASEDGQEAAAEDTAGASEEPAAGDPDATAGAEPDSDDGAAAGVEDETEREAAPETPRRVPSWARKDGDEPVPENESESESESESENDGKTADGPETEAERTSRFVALKDLDAPAKPTAPAAAPVPAPAAPRPAARPTPAEVVEPTREAPLPPLDLLAELTNTAPPPETPRRTVVRRVKVWTPILLLLAGAVTGAQLLRPLPSPQLVQAEPTHTLDGQFSVPWPAKGQGAVRIPGSGDIGTFGEQKPVPTASVAKVMTAYVVLKGHPLRKGEAGPQIEIDAKTVADGTSENESRIENLVAGTKFSQQDMLKMLMIPSGNNVARLLARWDTGTDSEAAFVEKMNAAARELGMTSTTYTDPSGLDAGTVSTATDQLKLAEAVMKDEVFRAVVALPSAEIKGLSKQLTNNNDLLTVNGLSVRGIKTGSSTPAGGALMWAAYKSVGDETPLILGTLMDQRVDGPDLNAENSLRLVKANSKKIIEAVRGALASAPVVRQGQTVGHMDDGLGGRTPLVATKDLNVIGVPGQQLKLTLNAGSSSTPHSAKSGTEVGVLTVGEGDGAKSVPVAVRGDLAEPSFGTRITRLR